MLAIHQGQQVIQEQPNNDLRQTLKSGTDVIIDTTAPIVIKFVKGGANAIVKGGIEVVATVTRTTISSACPSLAPIANPAINVSATMLSKVVAEKIDPVIDKCMECSVDSSKACTHTSIDVSADSVEKSGECWDSSMR